MSTIPRSDVAARLLAAGPSRQAFLLLRTVAEDGRGHRRRAR